MHYSKNHDLKKISVQISISLRCPSVTGALKRLSCHDKLIKRLGKDITNPCQQMREVVHCSCFTV